MEIINDPVFGQMTYSKKWFKPAKITMLGQAWQVNIIANAFYGRPIKDIQRDAYKAFCDNEAMNLRIAENTLNDYVHEYLSEFQEYCPMLTQIKDINDLASFVTPTAICFRLSGTVLLLLECKWDEAGGIAIKLTPPIEIGTQDVFL